MGWLIFLLVLGVFLGWNAAMYKIVVGARNGKLKYAGSKYYVVKRPRGSKFTLPTSPRSQRKKAKKRR